MFFFFFSSLLMSHAVRYRYWIRHTYNVPDICFSLTSLYRVFVKNSTRVKLSSPDELLLVRKSIHPDNAGIVLNVSKQFVSLALVKWIHKTSDFSVIWYVEHSIFWSCPMNFNMWKKKNKKKMCLRSILDIRKQYKYSLINFTITWYHRNCMYTVL